MLYSQGHKKIQNPPRNQFLGNEFRLVSDSRNWDSRNLYHFRFHLWKFILAHIRDHIQTRAKKWILF